ncbi:MAG TPA: class I SAM-dependent methyltransferase [Xanthobacteraceae bacterium]|nr:class I SAM-dependent methyltransferase [Xanthobacteraceae bacterium]
MPVVSWLRRTWVRFWLRRVKFTGRYGDLRRLYMIKDPWNLANPDEQGRFRECNRLIEELVPDCVSLLEVGCGEGLQTEHLLRVSQTVVGIDVSPIAIDRARLRLKDVEFKIGRAEDAATLFPGRRFDLVTAFEVLYYASDIPMVIGVLQQVGNTVLVTYFSERAAKMELHFTGDGWRRLDSISAGNTQWHCFVWSAPSL